MAKLKQQFWAHDSRLCNVGDAWQHIHVIELRECESSNSKNARKIAGARTLVEF